VPGGKDRGANMLFQRASHRASAPTDIKATVFRDDHSAETVSIRKLSFDQCLLSTDARFSVGEHLRVHVTGQGWIDVEVRSTSGREVSAVFSSDCRV
jgi:hypothetical protein